MKAHINGTVIAEASQDELLKIEGNWYFPPATIWARHFCAALFQQTPRWREVFLPVAAAPGPRRRGLRMLRSTATIQCALNLAALPATHVFVTFRPSLWLPCPPAGLRALP